MCHLTSTHLAKLRRIQTNTDTMMADSLSIPSEGSLSFDLWIQVSLTAALVCGGYLLFKKLSWLHMRSLNDVKRKKKQEDCRRSIDDLRERLKKDPISESELERIGSMTLRVLMEQLRAGKISPRTVLKVYQTKALKIHERTNCITEVIKEADEWARRLENGPAGGILWGIPVSIKDNVGIKGYDSPVGEIERVCRPGTKDSEILKILRSEGAIPFVKTNVPMTCLSFEPGNPINGLVYNPHNPEHGAGGSSSGEGALVGGGGSVLGVGSDLGGSIRIPSHFCGCVGFKPTPERMSPRGMGSDDPRVTNPIKPVWGPMARDVESLMIFMRTLIDADMNARDPAAVPIPFKNDVYNSRKRLTVGFYHDNGLFPTAPACKRAIEMAKEIFIKEGHQVVPWQLPDPSICFWIYLRLLQADGCEAFYDSLKYDRPDETIGALYNAVKIPKFIRKLAAKIIRPFDRMSSGFLLSSCGERSVRSYQQLIYNLNVYRRHVQDSWKESGLDLLICPPNVMPAPPFGNSQLLVMSSIYSIAYNVLHYPAGVVRMTTVNKTDIEDLKKFPTNDRWTRKAKEANLKTEGLPVGVQVVALNYKDELALRGMKILERGCTLLPIT